MERNRCHVCGGERFSDVADLDHRHIVRCTRCGYVFSARFSETELPAIYREEHYASGNDERIDRWVRENVRVWLGLCRTVERHAPHVRSLLDVGAGTGGFLIEYHRRNPGVRLSAVESSPEARESLKRRLPGVLFPVEDALDLHDVPEHYDVITLLQTLEHVFDPRRLCEEIHERLSPGGTLLVTVPNLRSYKVMLRGVNDGHCFTKRAHLQFFSASTLEKLLAQAGFHNIRRVVEWGSSNVKGPMVFPQWLLRAIGISTELRYLAGK